MLCAAGAARAVAIYTFLGGLLPGEDAIFSEAVFASAFRLVPYWLNNWERRWGAECTSVLFELPHFAFDLWVVLPLAQVRAPVATALAVLRPLRCCDRAWPLAAIERAAHTQTPHASFAPQQWCTQSSHRASLRPCLVAARSQAADVQEAAALTQHMRCLQLAFGRLETLFSPHIRVPAPIVASLARRGVPLRTPDARAPPKHGAPLVATDLLAIDPVRGVWTLDERQRRLWPRVRANARFIAFLAFLGAAALTNTLLTPRLLGRATLAHPRADIAAAFAAEPALTQGAPAWGT